MAVICPVDRQIAVDNREGNDEIIGACRTHPDRFRGLAVASPWFGARAEVELGRALDLGLVGLKMHPSLQGHYVNDSIVDPLIGLVEHDRGCVYVHMGTSEYSLPLELIDLAVRFPTVTFILGHSGGADVHWPLAHEALERCPNTLLETSHVAFTGYFHQPLDSVGPTRLVFGSDSPMGDMAVEKWKLERMGLAGSGLILGGNLQRLLELKGHA